MFVFSEPELSFNFSPRCSHSLGQAKRTKPWELPRALIKVCSGFSRDSWRRKDPSSPLRGAVPAPGPLPWGPPEEGWSWPEGPGGLKRGWSWCPRWPVIAGVRPGTRDSDLVTCSAPAPPRPGSSGRLSGTGEGSGGK